MKHRVWYRKFRYCLDCQMSWFEEAGEEPTCICDNE